MQKIDKTTPTINYVDKKFEINVPYSKKDCKTMEDVVMSSIETPSLRISENLCEKLSTIYQPAYSTDSIQTNPTLPFGDNYLIKQRYKYPTSAIPSLEKAIILLYQILKKIYDSELQQDCNPLNYIVFDDPDDYRFLDGVIKEILPND